MGALAYDLVISFGLCILGVLSVGPGISVLPLYTDHFISSISNCSWVGLVFLRTRCLYP